MKLDRSRALGVVIDVQERLHPHMADADGVERNVGILLQGLGVLSVPVLATEQYPKGLGPTIASIRDALGAPIEKIEFSCCAGAQFMAELRKSGRRQIIVAGIEAHVCVLQTAIDLRTEGYDVVVAVDCTSSRKQRDAEMAYRRMEAEAVGLGTYESILLELCGVAGTETFKAISRLIK